MRLLSRVLAAVLLATVLFHSTPVEAATKPSVPRAVKATPLNKAVKVTWAAPASSGTSRINAYAIQRRNTTSSPWVTVKYTGAAARAWTETGLVNGLPFYYRVMARNSSGWGPASVQVSAVPRTVPAAVRELEADNRDGALDVYWNTTVNNGAPIDRYEVQVSLDTVTWSAPKVSTTLRTVDSPLLVPLALGKRYWLRARAHNAAGYGPYTGAGPYRVYTKPGAVTGLAATVGSGEVELSWTAPVANRELGIPAASSYLVEVSTDGVTWTTDSAVAQSPWTVDGLTNGIAYQFRVSALSSFVKIGPGAGSVIAPGAPVGPPPAPQDLTLGWDETADKFLLAWQPPVTDGGKPLTRYQVEWWNEQTPPPFPTFDYGPSATEALVVGYPLDHQIHLRACNGPAPSDCGPWSNTVGPITGPVVGLAATQATAGTVRTVTVDWSAPLNGLATSYDVLRRTGAGEFAPMATGLTATDYVDSATDAATEYTYKVVPHGGGTGQPSTTTITTSADQGLTIDPATIEVDEGSQALAQVVLAVPTSVDTVVAVATTDPLTADTTTTTVTVPAGQTTAEVTVQGTQDDDLLDGATVLTATLGTLQATAAVDVTDDDAQAIVAPASLALADDATEGIQVSLSHQPVGPVTVTVGVTQNGNRIQVGATELVFTADDWDQPQTLQVTRNSPGTATVSLSAPGVTTATVTVTDP
ncbi:MAG TPA: fibronectin type III domain-containing protein [Nocardioides sp.]|nr:fibronectin type III domain-containing protein [Nocardioides sp.]